MNSQINRRGLFALLGRPLRSTLQLSQAEVLLMAFPRTYQDQPIGLAVPMQTHVASPASGAAASVGVVAVIQGRRCIALTSFCAACIERCPVPGALKIHQGMPSVVPNACTGCGVCQQVCPAPTNAVLLLPRPRVSTARDNTKGNQL